MVFQRALEDFLEKNIYNADAVSPNMISRDADDKYLVYQKIDGNSPMALDGPLYVYEELYQIDSYSYKKENAQDIAQLVKDKLNGFHGEMGDYKVALIEITSEGDYFEPDTELFRERMDIRVSYTKKGVKYNG